MEIKQVVVNGVEPSVYFLKRNPYWRHVNQGICFNVFEDSVSNNIFKVQSLSCGSEQIKEITNWTQYCIANQHFKYIPKLNSCTVYKFDKKSIFCIDSEKLLAVDDYLIKEIKDIFDGYIAKAFIELSDLDISVILERINKSFHFCKRIESDFEYFFVSLLKDLRKMARQQGDTIFSLDLHFNNFMIRPSTGQLVIVDAFSCSMYNE